MTSRYSAASHFRRQSLKAARARSATTKIDIGLAIVLTKPWELRSGGFQSVQGFWGMAHDALTGFAMLLDLIVALWIGPGRWSVDAAPARVVAADGEVDGTPVWR